MDDTLYGNYSFCGNCNAIIPREESFCHDRCEKEYHDRSNKQKENYEKQPKRIILNKYNLELRESSKDLITFVNQEDNVRLLRILKIIINREIIDKDEANLILDIMIGENEWIN
jgi:predicted amidophosphoribosyltransferase